MSLTCVVFDKILNVQCSSSPHFTAVMKDLYEYVNPRNNLHSPLVSKETLEIIEENADVRLVLMWKFMLSELFLSLFMKGQNWLKCICKHIVC